MAKKILILVFLVLPISLLSQTTQFKEFKSDSLNWWKLDLGQDSLASISWNKGIMHLLQKNNHPKKHITIAVLDTDFDLNHKMLSKLMLNDFNKNNNTDKNDHLGWNFLGIKNKDSALAYVLMEETRILRKIDSISYKSLKRKNKIPFEYNDVKSSYDSTVSFLKGTINAYKEIEPNYTYVMDTLRKLMPDEISITTLSKYTSPNDTIMGYVNFAKYYYENDFSYPEFISHLKLNELSLDICMNLEYDNRVLLQENSELNKSGNYGNQIFGKNISLLTHGTTVAGVIAHSLLDSTNLERKEDINEFPVRIMPITFTGIGDFTDKDFYLGFKYAIDNGANIINISQGKAYSIEPNLLKKALILAEKNNVLVVMSAGNQAKNLDENWRFPQSISKLYKKEFSNLVMVGATSKKLNTNLIDEDSNYGLESIDIFAPGVNILTTLPNNKFTTKSGTSYAAPIVTSVAALIWSHFPKLRADQLRSIILDSGAHYDGLINVPIDEENSSENSTAKQLFINLSKSGKIINAFNALTLAEKICPN